MTSPDNPAKSAPVVSSAPADRVFRPASLTERIPGQAVMEQLLALHGDGPTRSWWERFGGVSPLTEKTPPWYQGAVGEIAIGERLAQLGSEWTVLHAVPIGEGGTDIDHVAIGPAGVFTLNTKNHTGRSVWVAGRTFMVDGQRQPYIPKALHEAVSAAACLTAAAGTPVSVEGVLVLVKPRALTIREAPDGIAVVTDRQLVRWLQRLPCVLTSEQVAWIVATASEASTWRNAPPAAQDPAALQDAFDTLRRAVRSARRRRRAQMFARLAGRSATRFLNRLQTLVSGLFIMFLGLLLLLFAFRMAAEVLGALAT